MQDTGKLHGIQTSIIRPYSHPTVYGGVLVVHHYSGTETKGERRLNFL